MAYQKLQTSAALAVIPSATVMIPDVSTKIFSGTGDFSVAGTLTAVGASPLFTAKNIQAGAIVYNTTAQKAYYISSVTSDTVLSIDPSDAGGATDSYDIYMSATQGCILYVGTTGNLTVQMAADKDVPPNTVTELTYSNLPDSAFLPIQVVRVDNTTTASNIIALW
tara:strand:+ start:884 stop:1381 length:498 start_codon:yes stop_codon:yes gene_type:complete